MKTIAFKQITPDEADRIVREVEGEARKRCKSGGFMSYAKVIDDEGRVRRADDYACELLKEKLIGMAADTGLRQRLKEFLYAPGGGAGKKLDAFSEEETKALQAAVKRLNIAARFMETGSDVVANASSSIRALFKSLRPEYTREEEERQQISGTGLRRRLRGMMSTKKERRSSWIFGSARNGMSWRGFWG